MQAKACQLKMHIDIAKDGDCKDEPIKGRSGKDPEHEEKLDFTDDETDNQDDVEDTKEVSTEEATTIKEASISENNDDDEDATKNCNSEKCPDKENLVCGSDNITYKNKCILEKNNCNNGMNVELKSEGKCVVEKSDEKNCDKPCPRILLPVCANNGVTYNNKCEMEIAICKNPEIKKVMDGKCNKVKYDVSGMKTLFLFYLLLIIITYFHILVEHDVESTRENIAEHDGQEKHISVGKYFFREMTI